MTSGEYEIPRPPKKPRGNNNTGSSIGIQYIKHIIHHTMLWSILVLAMVILKESHPTKSFLRIDRTLHHKSSTITLDQYVAQGTSIKKLTGRYSTVNTNQQPCAMKPWKQQLKKTGTGVDKANNNQISNDQEMLHNVIPLEELGTEMIEAEK